MQLGPIVARELLTQARRRRSFGKRTLVPTAILAALAINYWSWRYFNGGPATVRQMALFGRLNFANFALIQIVLTAFLVPDLAGRSIAEETEQRTLPFLLASSLSSTTIILGKLAAGLGQYLSCLVAGLPVVLLLPCLGGVEPELVLWTYAGTLSTALFCAAFSMAVSVTGRKGRQAKRAAQASATAWLFLPILIAFVMPAFVPRFYVWIRPLNELMLASSPMTVFLSESGILPRGSFLEVLGTMIGLQLTGTAVFVLAAIIWLRPASRWHEDGEIRLLRRLSLRRRVTSRPPCGNHAMLWKEMYTARVRGLPRLLGVLVTLLVYVGVGVGTYYAGRGAVSEVLANGYASGASMQHRIFFSNYLRFLTVITTFVYTLIVTGFAAEAVALERSGETWLSLIATPLTGREILHAKMFGAFWCSRVVVLPLVTLWFVGMLAGAVHPIGFATALVSLAVTTWFLTILGTYGALHASTFSGASNVALLPVLLLDFSGFVPGMFPEGLRTVLLGVCSFPLVQSFALLSYDDMRAHSYAVSSFLRDETAIGTGEGTSRLLVMVGLAVFFTALAAAILERLASRQFDRLVGRPWRPTTPERSPAGTGTKQASSALLEGA
jgi:ABC-type transport system involved in multi-copper enzyme maturation permease subunit